MNVASSIPNKSISNLELRNERGIIRILAHPEAEKPEEQHLNAQYAYTKFSLAS
jgi:hypothetical protein